MKSGTAIGLMVGGAVLLLAASPKVAAAPGQATTPAGNLLNTLNPLNWFGGAAAAAPVAAGAAYNPFAASPATAYQYPSAQTPNLGWGTMPTASQIAFNNANLTSSPSPTYAAAPSQPNMTPAALAVPVMTPMGGFQSGAYMSPAPAAASSAAF